MDTYPLDSCFAGGIYPVSHLGCERDLSLAQLCNVSLGILDLASKVLPFHGQLLLARVRLVQRSRHLVQLLVCLADLSLGGRVQ